MSVISLNVCGLRSKLINGELVNTMKQYDIILLQETKTDDLDIEYVESFFSKMGYM